MYRGKTWRETDSKSADAIDYIQNQNLRLLTMFNDPQTGTYNESTTSKVIDEFKK